MTRVSVADRPDGCSDRYALDPFHVLRRKVLVMENETLRQSPSDADRGGHRDVDAGGTHIGEFVKREGRLMRHHAHDIGPANLWPEDGFHVVAQPGYGEAGVAYTPRETRSTSLCWASWTSRTWCSPAALACAAVK